MTDTTEIDDAASTATTGAAPTTPATPASTVSVSDRRRPGRRQEVSPELIPLLRGQEAEPAFDPDDAEQTAAARGLFYGVLLSIPIWGAIAYAGSWLLSR